ncbi:MAG: threonylcarbamoyl-AMP synthase [Alphaproteobacteria bacterium]|nr:threonylcarbamoyl-AMP synthase [Alphaproteobacteria bacterium]
MIVPASDRDLLDAAARLRAGEIAAFPTETVYGLGADATNDMAVAKVYAAKGRPQFNPLIVHVTDSAAAGRLVAWDARAEALARAFWPGPLTLVRPRRADCPVSLLAGAGLDTLAVRAPAHPVAQALLAACGRPLAAPSANRSGAVSPTTAAHVAESLGAEVLVLDGGACRVGIESTVLDLTGDAPVLLREGGLEREAIEDVIGKLASAEAGDAAPRSPGRLASHYAPRLALRLHALVARADEALLAFGPQVPPGAAVTLNLSPAGDPVEAAANLFAMLRLLDRPGLSGIAAMTVPERGLGRAVNDRLRRAAAPRPLA